MISNSTNSSAIQNYGAIYLNGLIITAGLSKRMGDFKPLLTYKGISFLANIILKLNLICRKIIIVTGFNSQKIIDEINNLPENIKEKIEIIYNSNYENGMFTSLQCGLTNCYSDFVIYHFVDQPNIPEVFYNELISINSTQFDWIQPKFNGEKGHPIVFNQKVIKKIIAADFNSNLRNLSASEEINKYFWECKYREILFDADTQGDFAKINK